MSILTIILFFLYFFGWGYTFLRLLKLKESDDWVERQVMRIGMGIPLVIVGGVLLNLVNIPLYWWLFLLPLGYPLYHFLRARPLSYKPHIQLTKKNILYLILLLLFAFTLFMYVKGSFAYPYLEDDDPWTYVREMKYIVTEKTLDVPFFRQVNYLDPYPPGYVLLLGIFHQTSPEAQWTIKFFNSLLISISVVFFFFMVQAVTKNRMIALMSTFTLAMIPSYLSHFIWAHALVPLLFMLLVYAFMKMDEDKQWWIVAMGITAAMFLTHHKQVIKLMIMAGMFIGVKWIFEKKFPRKWAVSLVSGFILSLTWWAFKFTDLVKMVTYNVEEISPTITAEQSTSMFFRILHKLPSVFSPTGGTGTRAYTFNDFFIAKSSNMINAPIGWGIVISVLLLVGLMIMIVKYRKMVVNEKQWTVTVLLWFIFNFLLVNSETFHLPFGLDGFRSWMLLALPVSIIAAYGTVSLWEMADWLRKFSFISRFKIHYGLIGIIIVLVIGGMMYTSGIKKYQYNTSPGWPPGGKWSSLQELQGYVWMKDNLPLNTKVFSYGPHTNVVIGFDKFACVWCEDFRMFKEGILEKDVLTVYQWMKEKGYEYLAFGGMELSYLSRDYGEERTLELLNQHINDALTHPDKFEVVHQNEDFVLFKVK